MRQATMSQTATKRAGEGLNGVRRFFIESVWNTMSVERTGNQAVVAHSSSVPITLPAPHGIFENVIFDLASKACFGCCMAGNRKSANPAPPPRFPRLGGRDLHDGKSSRCLVGDNFVSCDRKRFQFRKRLPSPEARKKPNFAADFERFKPRDRSRDGLLRAYRTRPLSLS